MFGLSFSSIVYSIPALLVTLIVFQYATAWVATKLGDTTPRMMGRLTLNPMAHIDWLGALAMVLIGFGWGRPVPVNASNFKDERTDECLVAFAGPIANLLVAFIAFAAYALGSYYMPVVASRLLFYIVIFSINFAIFNLLPIPPLAGGTIITAWLPWQVRVFFMRMGWLTFLLLILILNTPMVSAIFVPLQRTILMGFAHILGV